MSWRFASGTSLYQCSTFALLVSSLWALTRLFQMAFITGIHLTHFLQPGLVMQLIQQIKACLKLELIHLSVFSDCRAADLLTHDEGLLLLFLIGKYFKLRKCWWINFSKKFIFLLSAMAKWSTQTAGTFLPRRWSPVPLCRSSRCRLDQTIWNTTWASDWFLPSAAGWWQRCIPQSRCNRPADRKGSHHKAVGLVRFVFSFTFSCFWEICSGFNSMSNDVEVLNCYISSRTSTVR